MRRFVSVGAGGGGRKGQEGEGRIVVPIGHVQRGEAVLETTQGMRDVEWRGFFFGGGGQ